MIAQYRTIAEAKKTAVYKAVAPSLSSEDQEEFARMLSMVKELSSTAPGLPSAFVWYDSPQGSEYWSELVNRLDAANVSGGWKY
jgi:hypothetical protein